MTWITIAEPTFQSIDTFEQVLARIGGEPEGLEARYVGTADGTLRVVAVWESKEHADRFFRETLGPVLATMLGPEPAGTPSVLGVEVQHSYVRVPVA